MDLPWALSRHGRFEMRFTLKIKHASFQSQGISQREWRAWEEKINDYWPAQGQRGPSWSHEAFGCFEVHDLSFSIEWKLMILCLSALSVQSPPWQKYTSERRSTRTHGHGRKERGKYTRPNNKGLRFEKGAPCRAWCSLFVLPMRGPSIAWPMMSLVVIEGVGKQPETITKALVDALSQTAWVFTDEAKHMWRVALNERHEVVLIADLLHHTDVSQGWLTQLGGTRFLQLSKYNRDHPNSVLEMRKKGARLHSWPHTRALRSLHDACDASVLNHARKHRLFVISFDN